MENTRSHLFANRGRARGHRRLEPARRYTFPSAGKLEI